MSLGQVRDNLGSESNGGCGKWVGRGQSPAQPAWPRVKVLNSWLHRSTRSSLLAWVRTVYVSFCRHLMRDTCTGIGRTWSGHESQEPEVSEIQEQEVGGRGHREQRAGGNSDVGF